MLDGMQDQKLNSTASHPSSLSHNLPGRVICHPGHPVPTIMVLWFYGFGAHASFTLLSLSVGRQPVSVSATVTAVSKLSVSVVISVTAITGLKSWRHLQPKPENKTGFGRSLIPTLLLTLARHNHLVLELTFL